MKTQFTEWVRTHLSAILVTGIVMSNSHLLPSAVGAVAQVVASLCGVPLQ